MKKVYPIRSWKFWSEYLVQMRPYLLFVSGVAGASGLAAGMGPETPAWKGWIAFIPFFLGYGFGQALTDCFQTDTDKLSAPYRPLCKGTLSIQSVLAVSLTGLLLSGAIFLFLDITSFLLSLLVVAGLASYTYIKKHFWFGGPFYNAWIVAVLPLVGYYATASSPEEGYPNTLLAQQLVTFFAYANFVLIGYLKDIEADKATGYKTFPVVFGWNKTIWVGDVFALLALLFFWMQTDRTSGFCLFGIIGSIVILTGQAIAHTVKEKNEKGALLPILSTVRGFILLHIAMMLGQHPGWWLASLLFYALFEWALHKRESRLQV